MFLPDFQTRIIDRLFDSPDLYVPMIDEEKEAALVVRMTRETYSKSAFLDWRTERAAPEAELVPMRNIEEALRGRDIDSRPLRFIFHPAFAGSTLICRCLDHPGLCLPYKEPSLLLQISLDRRNSYLWKKPHSRLLSMDLAIALLSRTYTPTEQVVIKPADPCIILAKELITRHPQSRALFLNLPLEDFVVSMLKRPDRREFVRGNIMRAETDLAAIDRSLDIDTNQLGDAEAAAYVWYALMVYYLDALRDPALSVRSLDAAAFYANPHETLKALVGFFDLELTDVQIEDAVQRNVFVMDSKHPSVRMDAESRAIEDANLRRQLQREIDDARDWIDSNTREFPVPASLPRPLLAAGKSSGSDPGV